MKEHQAGLSALLSGIRGQLRNRCGKALVPSILGLAAVAALALLVWQVVVEESEVRRREADTVCENLADSIAMHIKGDRDYFVMISENISSHGFDLEEFKRFASGYVDEHPGLLNVSWVDSSFTIAYAEPYEENRKVVGISVVGEEAVRASRKAVSTGLPQFTEPFELIQGGTGTILFAPVFSDDGSFAGLVTGVYSLDMLVGEQVPGPVKDRFHIEIVDKNGNPVATSDVLDTFDPSEMSEHMLDPPGNGLGLRLYPTAAFGLWGAAMLAVIALLVGGLAWGWNSRDRLYDRLEAAQRDLTILKDRYQGIFEGSPVAITVNDFSSVVRLRDRLRSEGVQDVTKYLREHPEELNEAVGSIKREDANRNAVELYGAVDKEALTGSRSIGANFTDKTAADLLEPVVRFMQGETSASCETELLRSDGSLMYVSVTGTVVPGHERDLSLVLTCIIDITERKEAERRLSDSERRLKAIMDNIPDRAWLKSADGKLIEANEPYLSACGLSREELTGRTDSEIWPREVAESFMESDRVVAESGERTVVEEHLVEDDGSERWFNTIKTPIFDDDGTLAGTAGIAHEVTEQKELERQRQELHAMLSHDVRTPLTLIGGNADLLEKIYPDEDRLLAVTGAIRRSAEKIAGMFEDLVTISRLESPGMKLNPFPTDMAAMAGEACAEFREVASGKSLALEFVSAGNLPRLRVDTSYMHRAVANLVQNAVNYTQAGGAITVTCMTVPEGGSENVVVEVSDTGPGIPASEQDKVFRKYYRFSGTSAGVKGSGLGLAIVKAVVEAHGGSVELESEPGKGSTFRIVLPVGGVSGP